MSKLLNIPKEQFETMRAAAETEAQGILKARNAAKAEAEARKAKAEAEARKAKAEAEARKAEAEARKAEAAKAKAEAEARKAEASLRQKQMEAEEQAKKADNRETFLLASLLIILVIFSGILVSINRCQEEREREEAIAWPDSNVFEMPDSNVFEIEKDELMNDDWETEEISIDDNSSVEEMLEKRFDYVSEYAHYFIIGKGGKYGVADLKGNVKIKPKYDYISYADEEFGVVKVSIDGKYGMVSLKSLAEFIRPKYDYISSVSEESKTIEVLANSKYGLFSSVDLTEIIEPTYDIIGPYYEETGLFKVRKNSKYGLFSPKLKKEVASCIFSYISYEGGLYQVRQDGKSGCLNADGSILIPLQ